MLADATAFLSVICVVPLAQERRRSFQDAPYTCTCSSCRACCTQRAGAGDEDEETGDEMMRMEAGSVQMWPGL